MKKSLPLALAILLLPVAVLALEFTDSAKRYKDEALLSPEEHLAVSILTDIKAVEGNPDGTFRPTRTLNRAEFTKIVLKSTPRLKAELSTFTSKTCFPDVKEVQWFSAFVCAARERGILQGNPDGFFRPEREVNYAEALKILVNLYEYPLTGITEIETEPWYMPYARAAEERKVTLPEGPPYDHFLTRGQMARLAAAFFAESEGALEGLREKEKEAVRKAAGPSAVRNGYFPVFVRNIYALDIDKPGLLDLAKRSGVNTLTLGFFQTPAYIPGINTLEDFKAVTDSNDLASFRRHSAAGWYILGSGDNIARTNTSFNWTLNTSWSGQALAYVFENLAAIPRVLGIDLMDEPNYVYGFDDPANPPKDLLANLCLPSDAFQKLFQKINTARVKPRLGWNTSSPRWVKFIGDWATTENHAGIDKGCSDPAVTQFMECSRMVRDEMWRARKEKGDAERIPLVNVTGGQLPGYEKWNPGGLYTPGKDRIMLTPGMTLEDSYAHAAMQQWASAALGFAGVRVYSYDAATFPRDVRKGSLLTGVYAWTPSGIQRANLSRAWAPIGKPPSPPPTINALLQFGAIVVGTDAGIYQAAGELLDTWTIVEGTEGKKVLSFGVDAISNGLTYMGTDKGLFTFNDYAVPSPTDPCSVLPQPQTADTPSSPVKKVSGIPDVRILAMTQRGWNWEPGMYVGTEGKGLYVVHGGKGEKVEGIPDVTVHALLVTSDGQTLFVGTSDGLYAFSFVENSSWIPKGEIRHLLPGIPVHSFLQQVDGTMGIGTERGYYDYRHWLEADQALSLTPGIPGPVTHLAYVSNAGYEGDAWIHARTPSGIYVAVLGQPTLQWKKDLKAPTNARGLLFVNHGPQQVGLSEDGAPHQRRMWETITKTFTLMEELEPKLLTPVVQEEFLNENAVLSLRKGEGWQLMIAVNGTKDPLEVDPAPLLGASVRNPRSRLIRGPTITEKSYGRATVPPWSALVIETR